jgi:hypothetical protein
MRIEFRVSVLLAIVASAPVSPGEGSSAVRVFTSRAIGADADKFC